MRRRTRIGAIYRKELINVLRDRRTMTAMVVIPVVLYPLLMLGFVWAAEREQVRLRSQRFIVEVDDEATREHLERVIAQAQSEHDFAEDNGGSFEVRVGSTPPEELSDHVHLRVCLHVDRRPLPFPPRFSFEVIYNEVNVHSQAAMDRFSEILNRFRDLLARQALCELLRSAQAGAPSRADVDLILQPIEISAVSTATEQQRGGWILGRIIPIVLVLMTITGAIYPAIDLTAGERERGTLETLLVTPVPILHLIVGKFLVVATVAMLAAFLNVASVGATMHFGGLTQALAAEMPIQFPYYVFPIILACMIPFALLFSAILIAACSFARTFKEAQNYVMPVIIAAMIPSIAVTLPSVRLAGITLVMPVGNMVLLAREMLQQTYTWPQVAVVLLSTTLYASAAVAAATRLFGQEAVLFADAGSYKTLLRRRLFRQSLRPTASQALLLAALLFPASFYAHSVISSSTEENFIRTAAWLGVVQFSGLFVALPLALALYLKIDAAATFRLRRPAGRAWAAAMLLGASSWAVAHEFVLLQSKVMAPSGALAESLEQIEAQIAASPAWVVLLLLAIVPAVSEEFLFRGFLLSGLAGGLRKWPAILSVSVIFGVYHFVIDKMPITALMGVVLAYLCWQGRSVLPCMLFHAMHNGLMMVLIRVPGVAQWLGLSGGSDALGPHLPARVLVPALVMLAAGLALAASIGRRRPPVAAETASPAT